MHECFQRYKGLHSSASFPMVGFFDDIDRGEETHGKPIEKYESTVAFLDPKMVHPTYRNEIDA